MLLAADDRAHPLARDFDRWVRSDRFPCVGAKAAANRGGMRFVVARDLGSAWDDLRILASLHALTRDYRDDPALFQSLVVLFEDGAPEDEQAFERRIWERLQSLSDKDDWLGQRPDPRVGEHPDDPHFAVSFGGEGFFIVGLHPNASRPARRFPAPAMVFNLHDQFERLRDEGRFDRLRDTIQRRDIALAGSANPMLADHGVTSPARQYSGRQVAEDWRCPFAGRRKFGADDAQ